MVRGQFDSAHPTKIWNCHFSSIPLQKFYKFKTMKHTLYHGTSSVHLDKILESGLVPRYNNDSDWECASRPDMIYLTSAYPLYFAEHSITNHGGEPVVFEVEVDSSRLYPDEDFLEQATRGIQYSETTKDLYNDLQGLDMAQRTEYFRDSLELHKSMYDRSLTRLGNCCHKGIIKPKRIRRYVIPDMSIRRKSDPQIHMSNFKFMSHYYADLIHEMFNK